MKKLLALSFLFILLFPLGAETTTAGMGESVKISLSGTIEAKDLVISVRQRDASGELSEGDTITFEFPTGEEWQKEVALVFSYSSHQSQSSRAILTLSIGAFENEGGGRIGAELIATNLNTSTVSNDSETDRITLRTTFEAGLQQDTQIGTILVVFRKTEYDLFSVGNYTGEFSIEFQQEN